MNEWISTEDKLPETDEVVLAYLEFPEGTTLSYIQNAVTALYIKNKYQYIGESLNGSDLKEEVPYLIPGWYECINHYIIPLKYKVLYYKKITPPTINKKQKSPHIRKN